MKKKSFTCLGALWRRLPFNLQAAGAVVAVASLLGGCASVGTPGGGARDEDPPVFVRSNPAPGSVNVKRDRIDIEFNEIINVKDAFTKVVVSPTSKSTPRVSSQGRRVTVQFNDTLQPNTTYTVDFGDAIEDNNEGNKLQGFTYTFSTGPQIDSLIISGMVLSADGLEPQQGVLVGAYSNLSDTAFTTLPMERIAKTDDRGRFAIRGLAPGEYRIFSLQDVDNDYHWANPEEELAFYPVTVSPSAGEITVTDTLFNLTTGAMDSVQTRVRTQFLPNDILLRSYKSDYKPQYLVKYERVDSTRLSFIFNTKADSLPTVSLVNFPELTKVEDWAVIQASPTNDTLTYWLRTPEVFRTDSLLAAVTYLRTDSGQMLSEIQDTLRFYVNPKLIKDRNKKLKEEMKRREREKEKGEDTVASVKRNVPLAIKGGDGKGQEIYNPLLLEFSTPLEHLDTAAFRLEMLTDTVWGPVSGEWKLERLSDNDPLHMKIEYPWKFETSYRLTADTLAATGIYGHVSNPFKHEFKTKAAEDYSTLTLNIVNFTDSVPAFVELLNNDNPAYRKSVENGQVTFNYIAPGKYYVRIFEDRNGDGVYTPGDYETGRQPDFAYYYPKVINIKKNWDKSETWDVFSTPVDQMKPKAILKNKPQSDKRNRQKDDMTNEEEEEDQIFDPTRNPFNPNDKGRGRGGIRR